MVKSPAYIIYNGIVSRRRKIIKCDRKKTFIIGTILLFHTLYIITASSFFDLIFFLKCDGILYKLTNINNNLALIFFGSCVL